jgi:hypothetical protein
LKLLPSAAAAAWVMRVYSWLVVGWGRAMAGPSLGTSSAFR